MVMMRYVEGFNSPEVGTLLGGNPATIRVQLYRAVRRLRTLLSEAEPAVRGEG